ncbi:hypothetical protein [Rhizobium lentis]|uniref:Uncharacterized protein n=1 Tax=Rhizobium lentis TaxID=1138194 RepID=A0ABS7IBW2_9HYPH|nr:hypothetical protein [Rhizobium lentis]MBX5089394.1 hypothetical protein [Rhizobium lentis]
MSDHTRALAAAVDAFLNCRPTDDVVCQDIDMQMRGILNQQLDAAIGAYLSSIAAPPAAAAGMDYKTLYEISYEIGTQRTKALESLCTWLLHRFGPDSPEGREANARLCGLRSSTLESEGGANG